MIKEFYTNMLIYNIIILITLVFSILEINNFKFTIKFRKIYIVIYMLIVTFYSSKTNISADLESYKYIFKYYQKSNLEIVYKKISYLFDGDYEKIVLFLVAIQMIILYKLIIKKKFLFTLIYLFSVFNFLQTLTILRQSMAISFFIFGLKNIKRKSGKILAISSYFFHHFAFINLILLKLKVKKYNKNFFLKLIFLFLISSFFSKTILIFLFKNIGNMAIFSSYLKKIELNFYGKVYKFFVNLIQYLILIYIYYRKNRIFRNNEYFSQLMTGGLISLFFLFSPISHYVSERIVFSVNRTIFLLLTIIIANSVRDRKKIYREIVTLTFFYMIMQNLNTYLMRIPMLK